MRKSISFLLMVSPFLLNLAKADSCGPTLSYESKIEMPNGSVIFHHPQITQGNKTIFFADDYFDNKQICLKYLNMNSYVSAEGEASFDDDLVVMDSSGDISPSNAGTKVKYITCRP